MRRLLLIIFLANPLFSFSQAKARLTPKPATYPVQVENVLKRAGKNRPQLEKAIVYFKNDPQKLQAIYFLVANMDIHYSADFFWADTTGKRIPFDEKNYTDFNEAVKAFDNVKGNYKGIHPQAFYYKDIDTIKAEYLIDNVERAFKYWKTPRLKNLPFKDFCEYILPYRVSIEPLQNWRKIYEDKYVWVNDSAKGKTIEQTLHYFANDERRWFINTWEVQERREPLPCLGPLQLLSRAKGDCNDIAGLEVYALRSQGYPAALDMVPFWATSAGTHFFNNTFDEQLKPLPFDVSSNEVKINSFAREPSKVIRETYSIQPTALAAFTPQEDIPPGFMQKPNYIDVTPAHWETKAVTCPVTKPPLPSGLAYACVFSGGKWQPTWWGKVQDNGVTFTDMCKGVVYLPVYYKNNRLIFAGDPVLEGTNKEVVLKPDTVNKHTVTIAWEDRYLIYRPGKKYQLFYWNYGWRKIGEKTAPENATELVFDNVPQNALMILVPEYSEGKERPFTINPAGIRQWW